MPKIVDHDAYRIDLAERAVTVFLERGYSAVGMRELAVALGTSKSALYHYYPSKQKLFEAASAVAITHAAAAFCPPDGVPSRRVEKIEAIVEGVRVLDRTFAQEIGLVTDYMRAFGSGPDTVDPAVRASSQQIRKAVAEITGDESAGPVLMLCYGFLLQRMFDGRQTKFESLSSALSTLL